MRHCLKKILLSVTSLMCWPHVAFAQTQQISVHSGTGFFINPYFLITNEHVIHGGCKSIDIQDKGKPWGHGKIFASDRVHDLALIETSQWPRDTVTLRTDFDLIKPNDIVIAVGYPEETLKNGKDYEVETGKIVNPDESFGDSSMLQFTHIVKQGYSGGALLDGTGKVIGVVKGYAQVFVTSSQEGKPIEKKMVDQIDEAINLATLEQFLFAHNISYNTANYGDEFSKKLDFTVNVQCVDPSPAEAEAKPPSAQPLANPAR